MNTPPVSVIVAVKNEEKNIERCLNSIRSQNYPKERIELIVVDNASEDRTGEIAANYTKKIYNLPDDRDLEGIENFRGAQVNLGVEKSGGEIIFDQTPMSIGVKNEKRIPKEDTPLVAPTTSERNYKMAPVKLAHVIFFPDADMTFGENLIRNAVELIEKHDALYVPEIVCGRGLFGKIRNFERGFYNTTCIDAPRFVKKSAFEEVGGFDEKNIAFGFDDWDFTKSLKKSGRRLGITTETLYHHEENLTLRVYLAKKMKYAQTSESYIQKWGKEDPDIKKQFSPGYRFFGVFVENGKWRRLVRRPHLTAGMYFLRVLVGVTFLVRKISGLLCRT